MLFDFETPVVGVGVASAGLFELGFDFALAILEAEGLRDLVAWAATYDEYSDAGMAVGLAPGTEPCIV